MPKIIKGRAKKVGLSPGTLVHIGEKRETAATISAIAYDASQFNEKIDLTVSECLAFRNTGGTIWVNVEGIHQLELVEALGNGFGLHPLVLEDITNTDQRPKVEDHGDYLYLVLKMLTLTAGRPVGQQEIVTEQVSFILGSHFVLSFQEGIKGDVFASVRERLRSAKGRIRSLGADYLLYSLLDAIVDHYFVVLENLGEKIEVLEEELVSHPREKTLQTIHHLKREFIFLRRSIWPLREVLSTLERGDSPLIQKSTGLYWRDVYDHTIHVVDTIESLRDMVSGMLDIYLSSVSNRMNAVMKVLTIITTIFMPLTLIAGIYGMNFRDMPELTWPWGYPAVLLLMGLLGIGMLVFFRNKRWL